MRISSAEPEDGPAGLPALRGPQRVRVVAPRWAALSSGDHLAALDALAVLLETDPEMTAPAQTKDMAS